MKLICYLILINIINIKKNSHGINFIILSIIIIIFMFHFLCDLNT